MESNFRQELRRRPARILGLGWLAFFLVALIGLVSQFILSKQFVSIKSERQALEDRQALFTKELDEKQALLNEIREAIAQHQPELNRIMEESSSVRGELTASENDLQRVNALVEKGASILKQAKSDYEDAVLASKKQKAAEAEIVAALDEKRGLLDATGKELKEVQSNYNSALGEEAILKQKTQNLIVRLSDLTAQESKLKVDVAILQEQQANVTALKGEIETLAAQKNDLVTETRQLTANKTDLLNQVATLLAKQASLTEQASRIATLKAEIQSLEAEADTLNTRRAKLQSDVQQLAGNKGTMENLLQSISTQRTELAKINAQIQDSQHNATELTLLNAQLTQAQSEVSKISGAIQHSTGQLQALDEAIAEKRQELGALEEKIRIAETQSGEQ